MKDKLVLWLLRKIARRAVNKDVDRRHYISEYYKVIAEEARLRFTEDNDTTLDSYLVENLNEAHKPIFPYKYVAK